MMAKTTYINNSKTFIDIFGSDSIQSSYMNPHQYNNYSSQWSYGDVTTEGVLSEIEVVREYQVLQQKLKGVILERFKYTPKNTYAPLKNNSVDSFGTIDEESKLRERLLDSKFQIKINEVQTEIDKYEEEHPEVAV